MSKFEPLKYLPFGIQNIQRSCEAAMLTKKYNVYSQNTHTSCVYFYIKSSGLSPIYPNFTLRS